MATHPLLRRRFDDPWATRLLCLDAVAAGTPTRRGYRANFAGI